MDPISTILAALAAGAAAVAQETAGVVIKDTYEGFKALLKRKFAGKPLATFAVDEHAKDTATAESLLRPALNESKVERDPELLQAAQHLLKLADPEGRISKRYTLNISGAVQGLVQGDHANVTMNFGSGAGPRN